MAKWKDIATTEEYQKLPPDKKYQKKVSFFKEVISQSKKFKALDESGKRKVSSEFLADTPEDISQPKEETPDNAFNRFLQTVDRNMPKPIPALTAQGIQASSRLVNKVADKIAPSQEDFTGEPSLSVNPFSAMPRDSKAYMYGSLFPRQLTAEFVRSYTPENVATAMVAGPIIKGIGKGVKTAVNSKAGQAVIDTISDKIPEPIKEGTGRVGEFLTRNFTVGKGQPQAYQKIASEAKLKRSIGLQEADDIANTLSRSPKDLKLKMSDGKEIFVKKGQPLPQEYQQYVGNIFKGKFDDIEKIDSISPFKTTGEAQEFGKKASISQIEGLRRARETTTSKADELLKKPDLTDADLQSGMDMSVEAQFYREALDSSSFNDLKSIAKQGREVMDKWSKSLADSGVANDEVKKVIEDNVGTYMARMYKSHLNRAKNVPYAQKQLRLRLNGLKKRQALTEDVKKVLGEIKEPAYPTAVRVKELSETTANAKLFNKVASNPEWVADKNVTGDMIQMPNTPTMGNLKGKWVIKEIGDDINNIVRAKGQAEIVYGKALSTWKYGKVVLNPATHMRNIMTNTMLLDFSGVNHARQAQLLPSIVDDYLKKGELYQLARKEGAIGGEFIGGEIKRLRDFYVSGEGGHLSKMMNTTRNIFAKPGDLYQAEEQIAKLIKFKDVLEKTGNSKLAAKEAKKWLFDYNELPKAVDFARNTVSPFITFTYKAVPRVVEAMVNNPMRVYKYYALFNGFNEASRKTMGMSPSDYAREVNALPPWVQKSIGGVPANLMLPYRDKYGRSQFLNLEYILPFGALPDMVNNGVMSGINNPLMTLYADLAKNKDFRGKDIVPVGATQEEATKAVAQHIYRTLAPTLAPALPGIKGGYSFEKIVDAIAKRPDFADRTRELTPVILDTLMGLKINPVDVSESQMFKFYEKKKTLEEYNRQLFSMERNKAMSEKEKIKKRESLFKKINTLMKEK